MIKAWMYWDGGGYGVRWYEGDGTADIVTALPEHSPTGELVNVGEVTVTDSADMPLADLVLTLPDLLDVWPRPHETSPRPPVVITHEQTLVGRRYQFELRIGARTTSLMAAHADGRHGQWRSWAAWPTGKPRDAIKHAKQRAADEFGVNFPL